MSSSCLIPADRVGWVTPHVSAARPKCCSCASAIRYWSLSSMLKDVVSAAGGHRGQANQTIENFYRAGVTDFGSFDPPLADGRQQCPPTSPRPIASLVERSE